MSLRDDLAAGADTAAGSRELAGRFLARGFPCLHCHERLPDEANAIELVRERDGAVVGPFCNNACASAWILRRPVCEQRRR